MTPTPPRGRPVMADPYPPLSPQALRELHRHLDVICPPRRARTPEPPPTPTPRGWRLSCLVAVSVGAAWLIRVLFSRDPLE